MRIVDPHDFSFKSAGSLMQRLNLKRGALATLRGFVVGVLTAYGFFLCVFVVRLLDEYSDPIDWHFVPGPLLIGVLFAVAGFATSAPDGNYRFLTTLGIILLFSVFGWMLLVSMEFTPTRSKGIVHPRMYPSEFVVWFTPPIAISLVLAGFRAIDTDGQV